VRHVAHVSSLQGQICQGHGPGWPAALRPRSLPSHVAGPGTSNWHPIACHLTFFATWQEMRWARLWVKPGIFATWQELVLSTDKPLSRRIWPELDFNSGSASPDSGFLGPVARGPDSRMFQEGGLASAERLGRRFGRRRHGAGFWAVALAVHLIVTQDRAGSHARRSRLAILMMPRIPGGERAGAGGFPGATAHCCAPGAAASARHLRSRL
jgi:hypothetical protein